MQVNKSYKYHYLYKITNQLNGKFYIGIHSTNNLNDGYFGSGTYINNAIKKHGKENFVKEILEYKETREELSKREEEIVTLEFIQNPLTYNIRLGGDDGLTLGTVAMRDVDGTCKRVIVGSDEYYKLEQVSKGTCTVFDNIQQNYVQIPKEHYYLNKERYIPFNKGKVYVVDNLTGQQKWVTTADYKNNKNIYYNHSSKNRVTVKDSNGNYSSVDINDPRYLSGELKALWCERQHSDETRNKMKDTHKANKHQQGEKNSGWGTHWITKNGINIRVKKEIINFYLNDGWVKGRVVNRVSFTKSDSKNETKETQLLIRKEKIKQQRTLVNTEKLNKLLSSDYFSLTESQQQTYRKHKCWVCGSEKGKCKDPLVCKKHQLIKPLIKFGLDYSLIGSEKIIDEFYRVKNLIKEHYLKWNSNNEKLREIFNYNSGSANFIKLLKSLAIKIKKNK